MKIYEFTLMNIYMYIHILHRAPSFNSYLQHPDLVCRFINICEHTHVYTKIYILWFWQPPSVAGFRKCNTLLPSTEGLLTIRT